jgi:hypothetical protein
MKVDSVIKAMQELQEQDPDASVLINWWDKQLIQDDISARRGIDYVLTDLMWEHLVHKLDDYELVDAEIIYQAFIEVERKYYEL